MMQKVLRLLAFPVISLILGISGVTGQMKSDINADTEMLQGQAETVYFADGRVFTQAWKEKISVHVSSLLLVPFNSMVAALEKSKLWNEVNPLQYAMCGARNFRSPRGLGIARSDLIFILRLSASVSLTLSKHFSDKPDASLNGAPVWKMPLTDKDGNPWNVYIVQPESHKLVICPSLQYLKERLWKDGRSFGTKQH